MSQNEIAYELTDRTWTTQDKSPREEGYAIVQSRLDRRCQIPVVSEDCPGAEERDSDVKDINIPVSIAMKWVSRQDNIWRIKGRHEGAGTVCASHR